MNDATSLWAEHANDVETLRSLGYFKPLSFAQANEEVRIAWEDFETALAHHEPCAASDALSRWSDAIAQLRDAS